MVSFYSTQYVTMTVAINSTLPSLSLVTQDRTLRSHTFHEALTTVKILNDDNCLQDNA